MILADKICTLRKKNNWSQEELAEMLEVSRQSISKWESGNSIPDLNKVIKLSEVFGVSTDYLLRDDLGEESDAVLVDSGNVQNLRNISVDFANDFMNAVRNSASKLALAVALCIMSPVPLLSMVAFSTDKDMMGTIPENVAAGFGVVILLIMIAAATFIFVTNGMNLSKYEFLDKEDFALDYGVSGIVEKKKEEFFATYRKNLSIGIILCIVSVVPLLLVACLEGSDNLVVLMVSVLLLMVACGVFLIVYVSDINESYEKLLQINEFTPMNKKINRKTQWFSGAYWCVCVAIYLGISFLTDAWDRTWILWPVVAVLFAAIRHVIRNNVEKNLS